MGTDVELAPLGIVRGATRSIELLDRFGSEDLAELAHSITSDLDRQEYLSLYAQIFEREREILWEITAADDRFLKALTLSNRLVADKVREYLPIWQQQPRNKAIRRLEHTLYRYLARSIGRTTPNGLWAGTCLFRCGERTSCTPTTATYIFAPDLRPFQSILRSLGARSIYRQNSYWQINPTLKQNGDTWQFWAIGTDDGWSEIPGNAEIDLCLQTMQALPPLLWSEIVAKIDRLPAPEVATWLDALTDVGAIVGGLDLPPSFETVWDALVTGGAALIGGDRDLWELTIDRLHCLCAELSNRWEEIDALELTAYLDTARAATIELATELDIALDEIELPEAILHCDLHLPWQIILDRDTCDRLATTISTYNRDWLDRTSPSMQLRRQQRAYLQSQLAEEVELNSIDFMTQLQQQWTELSAVAIAEPAFFSRLQTWTKLLAQTTEDVYLKTESKIIFENSQTIHRLSLRSQPPADKSWATELKSTSVDSLQTKNLTFQTSSIDREVSLEDNRIATAPLGCFYFTPLADGELIITGIDDDPARAFARFGSALDINNELHDWLRQKLAEIASKSRVKLAELRVPFVSNPNVIARQNLVDLTIDLWSANPDSLSLQSALLKLDRASRSPVLSIPSLTDPVAVCFFCAANIGAIDPISNLLLYTSFQDRPIQVSALSMPLAIELENPIYTPRIKIESDEVIRPRRTILNRELLQKFIGCSPPDRYLMWQQIAGDLGWSKFINVQVDYQPSLLIKADSPLAIEAIFKSVTADTQWIIIEEVSDRPWLVDRDGKHYFAEFALPFQRFEHGWSQIN